jgi:hypothetical protein
MSPLYRHVYEELERAYGLMAEVGHRPSAASDGFGHITGPTNLAKEIRDYAQGWVKDEDSHRFSIGMSGRGTRVAMALVIEAARLLCARVKGGTKNNKLALRLLKAAVTEVERTTKPDNVGGVFRVESDLQRVLRANIEQLELGLKIIDGGRERVLETGRADIVAADIDQNHVVIELKVGVADDHAVTQIMRYMSELATNSRRPVRGILVAGSFSRRAKSAAKRMPDLRLAEYKYKFVFD